MLLDPCWAAAIGRHPTAMEGTVMLWSATLELYARELPVCTARPEKISSMDGTRPHNPCLPTNKLQINS